MNGSNPSTRSRGPRFASTMEGHPLSVRLSPKRHEKTLVVSPRGLPAVILILLITARSIPGTLIALLSVGVSICWVIGLMEATGSPLTLVSSSLPVLLVALGSAYSIHVLTQVLAAIDQDADRSRRESIEEALRYVTPPVLVAGLTTALAFLSFQVMDIAPMRTFGFWMAGGTVLAVLLALSLVPAACALLPLHAREVDVRPNGPIVPSSTPLWGFSAVHGRLESEYYL